MGFVLEYMQEQKGRGKKQGIRYVYRRRIPDSLRSILGKREFKKALGTTRAEALKAYTQFHEEVENLIKALKKDALALEKREQAKTLGLYPERPFTYEEASELSKRLRDFGVGPDIYLEEGEVDPRDIITEHLVKASMKEQGIKHVPLDDEGYPVGVDEKSLKLIQAMQHGVEEPQATLTDAVRLYVKERVGGTELKQKKDKQRIVRLVKGIEDITGENPELRQITREQAREFRDSLLASKKESSVRREFNLINAIVNHAITEMELNFNNPFSKMKYPKPEIEYYEDEGEPLPDALVGPLKERWRARARSDIRLIGELLLGTGCRLNEVARLRVDQVFLDHKYPHILVYPNERRSVKEKASKRIVPLIGETLEIAKEAIKAANNRTSCDHGEYLFPNYATENGGEAISQTLMNHVKAVSGGEKRLRLHKTHNARSRYNNHSYRHRMKGKLAEAGVPKNIQDMFLGHAEEGIGDRRYLGFDSRLKVLTEAMIQVHSYIAEQEKEQLEDK